MNNMISTFFLNENISYVKPDKSVLDINPKGFVNEGNIFRNLKSAIEWAISQEEDIIYCVCANDFRCDFNIDSLNETIDDLANEGIYSLYINAIYENFIPINENLITISEISSVTSFILISPIYEFVLSLMTKLEQNFVMEFNKFLEVIVPNAFVLSKNDLSMMKFHKIHIISPLRNVVNYIEDYLESITKQSFSNYQIIMIDDCSTDGSLNKLPELPFLKRIINTDRKFALRNIIDVLLTEEFEDDDIICLVDADDMLSHKYVLNIIDFAYQDSSILMTYGSMNYLGYFVKMGKSYNKGDFDKLRSSEWKMSHLRTFKYKVFKELLAQDKTLDCFQDERGNTIKMPYDMALLFPLLEIVGYENTRFINTPIYKYRLHPENDHSLYKDEQFAGELQIRNKQQFKQVFLKE